MVPTFEPDEKLGAALESVLQQAESAADMQIAVVDDSSTPGHVERLVRSLDRSGRIEVFANDRRLGLAGNWNRSIALARGQLVHLLHQDDSVLPGFYAAIDRGFHRAPDVGMAFCRSRIIDDCGRRMKTTSRQQWLPGVLANWLATIAERQRIQTPAAVVARSTYESVGGYRPELCHALDWEMWVRIAAGNRVWYDPRALRINATMLPDSLRASTTAASVRWHAASAIRTAERQLAAGASDAAAATLRAIPDLLEVLSGQSVSGVASRRLASLRSRLRQKAMPTSGAR